MQTVWRNLHWGHATSEDALNWTIQKPALAPVVRSTLRVRDAVVPTRSEEVLALARQSVTPMEIVVVDDQSTDATASIADRLGARVVSVPERLADWLGKPWASHLGAEHTTGDYLLFLDADVVLGEHGLEALLGNSPFIIVQRYNRPRLERARG